MASHLLLNATPSPASINSTAPRTTECGGIQGEVDAGAIPWQSVRNPSVWVRKAECAVVGQLGKLRTIGNRPTDTLALDGGGRQPPRRLPACPTARAAVPFLCCTLDCGATNGQAETRASQPGVWIGYFRSRASRPACAIASSISDAAPLAEMPPRSWPSTLMGSPPW